MSNFPNPIEVLRRMMDELNFQGTQRGHIVGIFSNEWNKAVAASGKPETIVVNEEGIEVAIERRDDGKYQFMPTTCDGQSPRINLKEKHVLVPAKLLEWAQQNIDCIEDEGERQRVSSELQKYVTPGKTA